MKNVRYFVIPDFSEFEATGRKIQDDDEELAKMAGYAHISRLGLENLETDTGKMLQATVTINAEINGARKVLIHPMTGSKITNMEEVLDQASQRSDVSQYEIDGETASFVKMTGSRRTEFKILSAAPGDGMMMPHISNLRRTVSLEDLADYDIRGDLLSYEAGRIARQKVPQDVLATIVDSLTATILNISTSFGEKPIVYYIMYNDRVSSIEVMPPIAARIDYLEFTSETQQLSLSPNLITYNYGESTVNISRHYLENFDIRGRLDKNWRGMIIDPPIEPELQAVRDILRRIPFRISSSDRSPSNVAYHGFGGNIQQVQIAPERGVMLDMPGYESNLRSGRVRPIMPEKKKYADCFKLPGRDTQIVIYSTTPAFSDRAKWGRLGAAQTQDAFDRLMKYQALTEK